MKGATHQRINVMLDSFIFVSHSRDLNMMMGPIGVVTWSGRAGRLRMTGQAEMTKGQMAEVARRSDANMIPVLLPDLSV